MSSTGRRQVPGAAPEPRVRAQGRCTRRGFLAGTAGLLLAAACTPPPLVDPTSAPRSAERPARPVDLWNGAGLDAKVLFQREIERLPEAPHMLRVTELEMAPGASIDPRTHLGPGGQVLLSGALTTIESAGGVTATYEVGPRTPFPVFASGMDTRYSSENRGSGWNRLFMAEILPRSREFLGNQRFDTEGEVHNQGGVRSGPYVQEVLEHLPDPPLMLRVSLIEMGPKGKTPEYIRPGPAVFFVVEGQATFRRQADLFITTHGAGGYFVDDASKPIILENKPITPSRVLAVEFLPAALGKQPSTVPTGRTL
jgi:quercetin dioxygenase-like cupin family protein